MKTAAVPFLRQTAIIVSIVTGALIAVLLSIVFICYLLIPQTPQPSGLAEKLARYALSNVFEGSVIQFDHMTLSRGSLREPLSLNADAIRLYPEGYDPKAANPSAAALETENFKMRVSPIAILTGQAMIDDVRIDNMKLIAQRDEKGRYRFGLSRADTSVHKATRAPIRPLDVLDRINNLHVDNASFILEDLATRQSETIANLSINLNKDPQFHQSLVTATAREDANTAVPSLDFVLTTTDHEKDAEVIMYLHKLDLARLTPFIPAWNRYIKVAEGAFTGEVRVQYDKDKGDLSDYAIDLKSTAGKIQMTSGMLRPAEFQALSLHFDRNGLKAGGNIENSDMIITATNSKKSPGGFDVVFDAPLIDLKQLDGIWQPGRDSTAQEWITEKLKNGRVKDLHLTGFWHRGDNEKWTMSDVAVDFKVEDMWVLYKHDLAPAENLYATGHFENDTLSLQMERGSVSGMNIIEGQLDFLDLTKAGKGDCKGLLRLQGSLPSVLSYLDNPIIRYKERVAIDLSKATGNVQMSLGLDFPTTKTAKTEHIKVDVDAVMTNANLPDIVGGITITGGPLALKGSPEKILLRGDVRLNNAPSNLTYETYFSHDNVPFVQKLNLKGKLDKSTLAEFGVDEWAGNMQSVSRYTLAYEQPVKGIPIVKATLSGEELAVKDADIRLSAKNEFLNAQLNGIVMGATRGDMNLKRNKNNGYDITFNGPVFDARPVLKSSPKKKTKEKPPAFLNASVKTKKLVTSDKGGLDGVTISYSSNRNGDTSKLVLDGAVGGKKVDIDFKETAKGDALKVDILDAGAFMRAMDVSSGIKGGEINVEAVPNGKYGSMKGRARIKEFTARDMPLLGRLINALSIPGMLQLFTSEGIYFDRLRSNFTWEKTNGNSILRLQNGTTRGSSLGLTFEGSYNQTQKNLDIKGNVVPLSEINNIVKKIPLLGPLLSGGRNGALVAASYTMKGTTENPRVFINPLSILTPGILRTILFESDRDYSSKETDAEEASAPKTNR